MSVDPASEIELLSRLDRALQGGTLRLSVDRTKLSHIDFPFALEADGNRWIYLLAALTAAAFWFLGALGGAVIGIVSVALYQTAGRAYIAKRLERRIRTHGLASVTAWRKIWRFGGVILTDDRGTTCQGPEGNWMSLVRPSAPPSPMSSAGP